MDEKDKAELEEFRWRERVGDIMARIILAAIVLTVGGCIGAVHKADAFIIGPGPLEFGVDISKIVRYYRYESRPQLPPKPVVNPDGSWEYDRDSGAVRSSRVRT